MRTERTQPLRIGVSGAPGVGKTTLATALAEDLGIPCLAEEMRAHLERTGRPLAGLPAAEVEAILRALWRERAARERDTPAFVADNSCLDFAAYAVFYDCLVEPAPGEPDEPELLREPRAQLARYDAIFILPCGALPYVRDGVRPDGRAAQLRHHLIIDGMLRRHADPAKLHPLPASCVELDDRRRWVRAVLARRARRGTVYLVGAGPGDPGLVTVRARELLAAADVVAHDALVPPAILALARPGAELLPVGRRHGSGAASYRLHPAVIARAAAGQLVVRLKAGDPLIFGRGGEEAEELAEAGIRFEIVPGISAALGAAAYAGIPLTHRAHASDVTFASGHDVDGSHPTHTNWAQLARGTGTLVLFMAGNALAGNLARLVEGGRAPTTPAAYVMCATTPDQRVVTGTLSTLAELVASTQRGQLAQLAELGSTAQAGQLAQRAELAALPTGAADPATPDRSAHDRQRQRPGGVDDPAPGLVIVGDVVGLRDKLAWFAPGPLTGRRLLVGRARPGPSAIAAQLRALGAEVLEAPELEVVPLEDGSAARAALEAALARLPSCAVVFGCAAGVDAVVAATTRGGLAPERVCLRPIIAIGEHAAAALARHGLAPAVVIRGACRDALAGHAAELTAGPLLLVTGEAGRDRLLTELIALGATVDQVEAYRTIARMPAALAAAPVDAVVLASSSCARAVLEGPLGEPLRDVPIVAMGPYTEAAARDAGARTVVCAARDDAAALVDAVVAHLRERFAGTRRTSKASEAPEAPEAPEARTAQPARPGARSLLVVYSGQGKGKTTAALGIVFRALGRGMRVAVVQFIKGKWKTGERLFAETLPELTFLVMGKGFTWNSDDLSRDRAAAVAAWTTAKQLIARGGHAIVVLDEMTYAINYGFIELDDVLAALRDRPAHVHVIVTGRKAPAALCELADLVTDMTSIKHPFERGVSAQLGIDY